jgi:hypothetical protein
MAEKGGIRDSTERGLLSQLTPWIVRDVGTGWRGTTEGEAYAT